MNELREPRKALSIPKDAAPHPESNLEWWYCYAILSGRGSRRYALMAAFFRVGEFPAGKGHYLIYSLIRLDKPHFLARSYADRALFYQMTAMYLPMYFAFKPGDAHTWEQYGQLLQGKLQPPHGWLSGVSVGSRPTALRYGHAELAFSDDAKQLFALRIDDPEGLIELIYAPEKPPALVDEKGTLNGLYYYSTTRNRVTGSIRHAEGAEPVSGSGWFDHQWGRNYTLLKGDGWNWFGLQFDDGRELLASELHRAADGSGTQAILVLDGKAYGTGNVSIEPLRHWRSLRTGLTYPVEWRIHAPELKLELKVAAAFDRQEMPILGPLRAIWEGVCRVEGFDYGTRSRVQGTGFAELAGYASKTGRSR